MRTAIILVRKNQAERIFEVIHNIITGHQYDLEYTDFDYFDGKAIAAIKLEAQAEVLHKIKQWLNGEFSDSACWMQVTMTGNNPMNAGTFAGAFADQDTLLPGC